MLINWSDPCSTCLATSGRKQVIALVLYSRSCTLWTTYWGAVLVVRNGWPLAVLAPMTLLQWQTLVHVRCFIEHQSLSSNIEVQVELEWCSSMDFSFESNQNDCRQICSLRHNVIWHSACFRFQSLQTMLTQHSHWIWTAIYNKHYIIEFLSNTFPW